MKIVRLNFMVFDQEFFFDRAYDEKKGDQQNCDDILHFLSEKIDKKESMALMQIVNKEKNEIVPALANFAMIPMITIVNVAVYDAKPKVDKHAEQPPAEPKGPVLAKE